MTCEFIHGITIRPLRNGEQSTIRAVFDRLGPQSRLFRFGGAKAVLTDADLDVLTRVDATHHVLVALMDGDPVGIARLVRDGAEAEVAVEVVDELQGCGIGTSLMARLAADARAAGIRRLVGHVDASNTVSRRLLRRASVRFA